MRPVSAENAASGAAGTVTADSTAKEVGVVSSTPAITGTDRTRETHARMAGFFIGGAYHRLTAGSRPAHGRPTADDCVPASAMSAEITVGPRDTNPHARKSVGKSTLPYRMRLNLLTSKPSCRSEEHTSELQSQSNLVCRLLLEKKKNNINNTQNA